jgi:tetratricopeptide (TPR) repeat protein
VTNAGVKTARPKLAPLEPALATLAFAAPLATYLFTLAPAITFGDAGELAVAAAKLGIGHPPGYPLAALAGQLFTLAPFGAVAWKTNLASAAATAATCFVIFLLLRMLFLSRRPGARVEAAVGAAAAAIAFGFGLTVWSLALTTEVYAFNALAAASTLYAGLNFVRNRDPRWAYAAAFIGGLALSAHFSSALIILPMALYMWARAKRRPGWRPLWLGAAAALLGLLLYLYLPLRAAQGPAINWGEPRTIKAAAEHIFRKGMGGIAPVRLQFLPRHLLELASALWREFTPAVLAASAAGAAIAFAKRLEPWRFLALLALVTGPLATTLLVLTLRADQAAEMRVWYVPFFMIAAAFAGLSLFTLLTSSATALKAAGYVAAAAVASLPLLANFGENDLRDYYLAADFGANLLRTMDYEGVNFMFEKDFGSYEIAYQRSGAGRRPDAEFVSPVAGLLPGFDALARERRKAGGEAEAAAAEARFEAALLPLSSRRGIYYNSVRESVPALGYNFYQTGLLYRVSRERTDVNGGGMPKIWKRYETRGFAEVEGRPEAPKFRRDVWLRSAICTFLIKKAYQYFGAGGTTDGFAVLARAEPLAYGLFEPLANIGAIYMARGRPEEAAAFFERAARAVPRAGVGDEYFRLHYAGILARKGDAYREMGREAAADAAYREAREAYPVSRDEAPPEPR